MVTNLEKAENEVASYKGQITYLKGELASHATVPLTQIAINHFIGEVALLKAACTDTHTRILHCGPADIDDHIAQHVTMLGDINKLTHQFLALKVIVIPTNPQNPPNNPTSSGIRLPKIELPSFDGDLSQWMSFKDLFIAAVHENDKVSKAQKLTYLKSSIKGDAATLIGSMMSTDANYDLAWKALQDRYQHERDLVFALLRKFFDQAVVQGENATALRSLIDVSNEAIRSLEILQMPVEHWDPILVYIIQQKIDPKSRQEWELSMTDTKVPKLEDFLAFLEQRARALASGHLTTSSSEAKSQNKTHQKSSRVYTHHADSSSCKICNGSHPIFRCQTFRSMQIEERRIAVRKYSLCFNCLGSSHSSSKCPNQGTCKICQDRHNTLLHISKKQNNPNNSTARSEQGPSTGNSTSAVLNHHTTETLRISKGMLATAIVKVVNQYNSPQLCRVFLDSGSTASFITEACARRLGLSRTNEAAQVTGIASSSVGLSKGSCMVKVQPYFATSEEDSFEVPMLVLQTITSRLPTQKSKPNWPHLNGLQLADPEFYKPAKIDMLLGSDIFWDLLLDGKKVATTGGPIGVNSKLGWLVAGNIELASPQIMIHHVDVQESLDKTLQQFWELESIPTRSIRTREERQAETHFSTTFSRHKEGKFIVALPFKSTLLDSPSTNCPTTSMPTISMQRNIGSTKEMALRRLISLEKRLGRNPSHRQQYEDFMHEYLTLGHMEEIPSNECMQTHHSSNSYYIPHHFVLKESSSTTKFRVVFDASAKSSSGISLNECLMVGPTIQDSLMTILMRFRTHPVAFTADIAKMYRQICIRPEDRNWQRILWRFNPSHPIKEYRLLTVTYGTASAPFHATRVLAQLAKEEQTSLPLAAKITLRDFYVDDLISGESTTALALETQSQLLELMERGCFPLRKWYSNDPMLLANLPSSLKETESSFSFDQDEAIKTLGLRWNPASDNFSFKVTIPPIKPGQIITKRAFLSDMSRVFDPLGWLAPVVIRAKILFQSLWKQNVGWDDTLPLSTHSAWITYRSQLLSIESIDIPRCIKPISSGLSALHGFSDASEQAYAAVVYLRTERLDGEPLVSLIASKTRVSPAKQISLPRLELCGALLLVNLLKTVQESLHINISHVNAWTDSTVVLSWLNGQPTKWKTFVANRVAEIQEFQNVTWGHVSGTNNPADCASRGIHPDELSHHPLWWTGPSWLRLGEIPSSSTSHSLSALAQEEIAMVKEEEKKTILVASVNIEQENSFLQKFSSWDKLSRITAWCLRFAHNSKAKQEGSKLIIRRGLLACHELADALVVWVKVIQAKEFLTDIQCIKEKDQLPTRSRIRSLHPYIDASGVLKVGGRLKHATIPASQKYPMLLPRHGRLTELLIIHEHERSFHGGPQLVLTLLQRRFWIIGAKDAVRHQIRKCVRCARFKAATMQQVMGDLPKSRVTPTRPFLVCGVDYAGPFTVRAIPSRSKVTFKAYLAIFVCFSTRAVHLEIVSSMSTSTFLAALRRFVARRGLCSEIYSDCGTNFVGANRELKEFLAFAKSESHNTTIAQQLASHGIKWHLNPPGAPHFGGLWEAGVKSTKYHLHRIMGTTRVTFEELTTLMTQIEACLNSRPLTPVSTDPEDMTALTPGHFLIGDSLLAIPEPNLTTEKINRLSRWQHIQQLSQHFWHRWSTEYLTRLQQRPKWLKHRTEIQVNDMVLIKEENLPPLTWRLGRIVAVHPGSDNIVRVATVKTADGMLKRPIVKLCHLPIDSAVDVSPKSSN